MPKPRHISGFNRVQLLSWAIGLWGPTDRAVYWSVPLIPDDGTTLAQAATGAFNEYYEAAAEKLAASGTEMANGDIFVRTGWEMGGGWFPWGEDGDAEGFNPSLPDRLRLPAAPAARGENAPPVTTQDHHPRPRCPRCGGACSPRCSPTSRDVPDAPPIAAPRAAMKAARAAMKVAE